MGSAGMRQGKMGAKMLGSIITAGVLLLFATAVSTTYAGTEPELRNNVKEEPNCFLCQIIVESLGYVCDTLGEEDSSIVSSCHAMVEEYLEIIIDMIVVQLMQPFEVCSTLNICP